MQRVGQNMHIRITPIDQLVVHPDLAITVVISAHLPVLSSLSPLGMFAKVAQIRSVSDIKLRKISISLTIDSWKVNNTDIKLDPVT
ncbi:hypothetical protein GCM10016455_23410 [Aliiroseovarius zhejiangensis]|uniref:Uncharacterized protein n=1 Tax=Aliiroseovarius zhejiangensis TaxID=1632025 RepID=A0ABQ3J632_9RHOB|nr:hypothetical protein GCM10016455_23410 [Aliiroseovarius zhejiangensis]